MGLTTVERGGLRLLVPDDDPGALVAFSDREGGVSDGVYRSLNLAARVGDDVGDVTANRQRAAAAVGFEPGTLALARQVHGAHVIEVGAGRTGVVGEADVLVTRSPEVTLGILTADCAAVVVVGHGAVAVAHAGWRGLVAGAVDAAVAAVGRPVRAWVGPAIHECCYEVGPEVVGAFEEAGLPVAGPACVDPGRAAGAALERAGVTDLAVSDACTSCDARYFSYRRDGLTGRQGAFVSLRS